MVLPPERLPSAQCLGMCPTVASGDPGMPEGPALPSLGFVAAFVHGDKDVGSCVFVL